VRFNLTIPDPAVMRVGKEAYVSIASGTELHRIHSATYKAEQFNPSTLGNARFSPILNAHGAVIPTIYAAETFACATCEIILRNPDTPPVDPKTGRPTFQIVYPADFKAHCHSVIRTRTDLNLVDLTNAGQRKIGVSHNALLAGPRSTYSATRAWAEHIHAMCPNAHGIYYSSVQYGPDFAIVLFGDRTGSEIFDAVTTRSVADPICHAEIRSIADGLSIDYEDV